MPNPNPKTDGLIRFEQVNTEPVYVSVQIERKQKEFLDKLAGTRSHHIRQAIKEYLENRGLE
jgi:hypothetical protein